MNISPEKRFEDYKTLQNAGLICLQDDFFPSVHYPPITMYPQLTAEKLYAGYTPPADDLFDIYVHIPFCEKQCTFCHYPVMSGDNLDAEKDKYLQALINEMRLFLKTINRKKIKARTVLIGGGTPTFLTIKQLQFFLQNFADLVDLSSCTQFNYDLDPNTMLGDIGRERLELMKSYGVDRLTIGVQEFDDGILKTMNRPHDAAEAEQAIERSLGMGFQTNIEFIFGLPGQTRKSWDSTILRAIQTKVQEIQLYRLKVIPYGDKNGFIQKLAREHPEQIHPIKDIIYFKQKAINLLAEQGYSENLTRVFTKERKHISHYAFNQCCNLYDQVGFGLTGFSSLRDRFALNTQHLTEYYSLIEQGQLPVNRGLVRNQDQQDRWAFILPIKNSAVRKKVFSRVTGRELENTSFYKTLAVLKEHGLIEETANEIKLNAKGRFFADEICALFYEEACLPFPENNYQSGPLNPFLFKK